MREAAANGTGFEPGLRPIARFGAPREIVIDDPESLASALMLTQSEIEDLRDPFTEHFVDIQRNSIGRTNVYMRTDDSLELFD